MLFRRKVTPIEEDENSFWISYSDILSSLLIIILLITVYVIFELMQTKKSVTENLEEITKAELVRKETLEKIQNTLSQYGVDVEIANNYSVLRIPESTLAFESNDYRVPYEMEDELIKIGEVILKVLTEGDTDDYFDTIFIEGHTDIRPSKRELGNLGLSTFRAISVWNFWRDRVSDEYSRLSNLQGDKMFSVGGYGETRPAIEDQKSEEDYRKNRRIDIRFTIRKPTSLDYSNIIKMFDEN